MSTPERTDPKRLVREGTDRRSRSLPMLSPDSVPVDERAVEHQMVFASRFSRHLEYRNLTNNPAGDWGEFFSSDPAALLAVAAVEDVSGYRTTVKELLRALENPGSSTTADEMAELLGTVFARVGSLASGLDALRTGLPGSDPLAAALGNLIRTRLSPALRRLVSYYRAGGDIGLFPAPLPPDPGPPILGRRVVPFDTLSSGPGLVASEWCQGVTVPDWTAYLSVAPTPGAFGDDPDPVRQANHLATHNLFTDACDTFLAALARVSHGATTALQESLASSGHPPHYALFLAFLRLLEHARAETNTLTARHLDFYYRQVLGLERHPARADTAHLLVELAKQVDHHLLETGRVLTAGKDDRGRVIRFATESDLVANTASVAALARVYRHGDPEPGPVARGSIFADRPENVEEPWNPFATKQFTEGRLTGIDMPPARIGFAVASHLLWMREGTRRVTVVFTTTQEPSAAALAALKDNLAFRFTTADGWLEKRVTRASSPASTAPVLMLEITLNANDPPITPYDAAVHGENFPTGLPVLAVTLTDPDGGKSPYPQLAGMSVTNLRLEVDVKGVRSLTMSNDHGPVDPSKPFLAFGAAPTANSSLVIGSKEVFGRNLSTWALNVTYQTAPRALGTSPEVHTEHLDKGSWSNLIATESSNVSLVLKSGSLTRKYRFGSLPVPSGAAPDFAPAVPYSTASRTGYVRLRLGGGFGTDKYPIELAKYLSGKRADEPIAPVVPVVDSININYKASREFDLSVPSEAGGRFFHLGPFGHTEPVRTGSSIPLLPRFGSDSDPHAGELHIGIAGLNPPENLTLLFAIADGTADPRLEAPAIEWSYLSGNEWKPFASDAVSDGADGLQSTGIVTLAVPADASGNSTLLPGGLHWIRLAVASNPDAVCRLRFIRAQAVTASRMVGDDGTVAGTSLPAGSIAKLAPADPAVKEITQPLDTFSGSPPETDASFATRVSERLRHRDRAIALWDYEHLVLEAFPEIYRVRCLNHTRYEPDLTTGIYDELAPGHVTIMPIPDLRTPNPNDPLRPSTSLRVLRRIEQFLSRRTSGFVKLHVRNPQFEEVRVDVRVRFVATEDETFSFRRLQEDLAWFLSPWAFDGDARPSFNGAVTKSKIVDFVVERPYVELVSDLTLHHLLPGATGDGPDLDEVVPSRAVSILVSVPPGRHGVHPLGADELVAGDPCPCPPGGEVRQP